MTTISNDIIETSDDWEDEGKSGLYPYYFTQADIDIRETRFSIYEIMRRYKDGRLIVNSDFQRNFIWNPKQQSKFIESIILNFPLPPFYVSETREGRYIIIDGLQRATTIYQFIHDDFRLNGLEVLWYLNGKNFSDLKKMTGAYQVKIEDKVINFCVLRPSIPIEVVYDLLNRVNTTSTKLERQELRNIIFIGNSTQLLKDLSETDYFKRAIDNGISPKRMKDREVVLRYLAFQLLDYQHDYKDDMSSFLEKAMRTINKMSVEQIELLKIDFKRVMQLSYDFFGNANFRLPFFDEKMQKTTRGRINIALLESVAYFFSKQSDDFLIQHKEKIINNFDKLLVNKNYLDAVQKNTNTKSRVETRFTLAQQILGDVHAD